MNDLELEPTESALRTALREAAGQVKPRRIPDVQVIPRAAEPRALPWKQVLAIAAAVVVLVVGVLLVASDDEPSVNVEPTSDTPATADLSRLMPDRDLEVFLAVTASPADVDAIRSLLVASPDVREFVELDHAAAHQEFARLYSGNPDLVSSIHPEDLPISFRVRTADSQATERLRSQLRTRSEVVTVDIGPLSCSLDPTFRPFADGDFEAFLSIDASPAEIDAARALLAASPEVQKFVEIDRDAAYQEFLRIFRDKPDLIESVKPGSLPVSFRVRTTDARAGERLRDELEQLPGVEAVEKNGRSPRDECSADARETTR
jgi:cell division protein FtsX